MCIYVSMQPSIFCDDKDRNKRITAAKQGRMTGHWCSGDGFTVGAENPRTYGNDFPKPSEITKLDFSKLTSLRRKLIGLPSNS